MCQRDPVTCIGITPLALTVTVHGKPALVIPVDRFPDLIARLALALTHSQT